jgi:hypothetical protein
MSNYSDVSIDPVVRMKAEKILEYQKDRINFSELEVINEEESLYGRLNSKNLQNLPEKNVKDIQKSLAAPSLREVRSSTQIAPLKDIFESKSRFEEDSNMD